MIETANAIAVGGEVQQRKGARMSEAMPNSNQVEDGMPRWSQIDAAKVATLDAKVTSLDDHVKQIDYRIDGVYKKIDGVATEVRMGLDALAAKLTDRSTPKFGVIFAGLTLMTTVLALIGGIAWYPIKSGLDDSKADIRRLEDHRYAEQQKLMEELRIENRTLHHKVYDK